MSKAAKWAKEYRRVRDAAIPDFKDPRNRLNGPPGPYVSAKVGTDGTLSLHVNDCWVASMRADDALALANWVLDVFGDAP